MSDGHAHHVCPPWIGYFLLANPLRRVLYSPQSVLGALVSEGMTVVEPGPGMGYFTLALARMVAPRGRVVVMDIQPMMLDVLRRRARRAGVQDRIDIRLIQADGLGIADMNGKVDFFLAFAMVHEVPDARRFFHEASASLKNGGKMLFSEPSGHVGETQFARSLEIAAAEGLHLESRPAIRSNRSALLIRK